MILVVKGLDFGELFLFLLAAFKLTELQQLQLIKIRSNFYYARCITPKRVTNLLAQSPASLRPGTTAPFEEMSQRWRVVGNTLSELTDPRFEPQTSRSRDESVTDRPTGRRNFSKLFGWN